MTPATLNFLLGEDGMSVAVEAVEGDNAVLVPLDAADLSTVIANLGQIRAKINPPIERQPGPNPIFSDVTEKASFYVDRVNVVSSKVYIAVRHDGFGWMAFAMSAESMVQLAGVMAEKAMEAMPKSPIVGMNGKPLKS